MSSEQAEKKDEVLETKEEKEVIPNPLNGVNLLDEEEDSEKEDLFVSTYEVSLFR